MIFRHVAILLLVTVCVAHNGRRRGPGRYPYRGRSSGCQRPYNSGRFPRDLRAPRPPEYLHQPRRQPQNPENSRRERVMEYAENVVLTVLKPACEKESQQREQSTISNKYQSEEQKNKRSKSYDDNDGTVSFRQSPSTTRSRNDHSTRALMDDRDEYGNVRQQSSNRNNRDNNRRRGTEEDNKEERYSDNSESYNQQQRSTRVEERFGNQSTNGRQNSNIRSQTIQNQDSRTRGVQNENRPAIDNESDFPDDEFQQIRNNDRELNNDPNLFYDQYENYFYEDYSGFSA